MARASLTRVWDGTKHWNCWQSLQRPFGPGDVELPHPSQKRTRTGHPSLELAWLGPPPGQEFSLLAFKFRIAQHSSLLQSCESFESFDARIDDCPLHLELILNASKYIL